MRKPGLRLPTRLYHIRGRLYCELCVLRCRTRIEKERAVVVEQDGLECERCARFGFPNIPKRAKEIIRDTKPSGYRLMVLINEHEGTAHPNWPMRNSDPSRWPYGFTKADVTTTQRALKAVGVQLSWDMVDAALHALHFGAREP